MLHYVVECFLNSCWMCFLWIRMTLTFIGMTLTYILLLQMTVRRRCVCQNSSKLIAIPTVYRYLLSFGCWSLKSKPTPFPITAKTINILTQKSLPAIDDVLHFLLPYSFVCYFWIEFWISMMDQCRRWTLKIEKLNSN